jgi:hypothetical protein
MPSFTYDPRRRYSSVETGQYVTSKQVRAAVDTVIDGYQADIVAIASKLTGRGAVAGRVAVADRPGSQSVARGYSSAANGGFNNMSQSDYGFVGSLVKKQYAYLRDFAGDIASGKQLVAR